MTPDRAALIAWVKEQEAFERHEASHRRAKASWAIIRDHVAAHEEQAQMHTTRADHFAALHALLEADAVRLERWLTLLSKAADVAMGPKRNHDHWGTRTLKRMAQIEKSLPLPAPPAPSEAP